MKHFRLGNASSCAPRGGLLDGNVDADELVQHNESDSDCVVETTSDGTDVLGTSVRSSKESTGNSSRNSVRGSGVEDTGNPRQHCKRPRKAADRLVYNVDYNGGSESFAEPNKFGYVTATRDGMSSLI